MINDTTQLLGPEQPDELEQKLIPQGLGEEQPESVKAQVKKWFERIDKAEVKYKEDFERMRDNMDFVASLQWKGQDKINYDRYVANWTIRAVNANVAMLYAKNPQVEAKRNFNRLNYQLWDGKMETLMMAAQLSQMAERFGFPLPPDIPQLLQDFQQGRMNEARIDRVAMTLQYVLQYQIESQTPDFKLQMKQLVRRVNVCGVGYIKPIFCREGEYVDGYGELTQSKTRVDMSERLKLAMKLLEKIQEGKIQDNSADIERAKQLLDSLQTHPLDVEATRVKEYITYDFPRATSILVDPNTRTLKGFVGAHWIAEKMFWPLEYVNSFFETDIKPDEELKYYDDKNMPDEGNSPNAQDTQENKDQKKVCVYVIHDLDTKSDLTICKGYKGYLCPPEVVTPAPRGFWTIFPVTFNDVEVEEGCKATIYPPSLVDLIKPAQKEWNRIRDCLRRHRRANGPKYMYIDNTIGEDDLDAIITAEDQQTIKLKGVPPGTDPGKVLVPLQTVDIKKELYDAEPLREDSLLASGQQEANQGPPQPNITATGVNVAEQSRMGVAASDIDGLDDSLTAAISCSGEMCLSEMSTNTVQRIVGVGAVWPEQNRQEFLDAIEVKIKAASSGKPNQVVELNKWQAVSNILVQFGANPQAVIRETLKRFDETLEPAEFFPIQGGVPMGMMPGQPQQQPGPQQKQPPQNRKPRPKPVNPQAPPQPQQMP